MTKKYGLIGRTLKHSFSKLVHEQLADYSYELISLPDEAAVYELLTGREFAALNVTIPYKETVMPMLDIIDDKAVNIGAVNTIVNRDGRLYGYNTDYDGFKYTLEVKDIDVSGKKVIVAGAGGAGKAVQAVLKDLGAKEIITTATRARGGIITSAQAEENHSDAQVIINTSPVGMFPEINASPVNLDVFAQCEAVVDIVYNPIRTKLMLEAEDYGIKTAGGLDMLVMQAVKACEHFTGGVFASDTAEKITAGILDKKLNIVVTGMPSSGKSTIGSLLAEMTGKKFIDTDEMVVQAEGRSIKDMWQAQGEAYFRMQEHAAVQKAALMENMVISTGGGVIKNDENMRLLKHNGVVVFIDRSLKDLVKEDAERPLCTGADAVEKMYRDRHPVYKGYSDVHVINNNEIENTVKDIFWRYRSLINNNKKDVSK